ncbi:uncharacterized protein CHSO_3094 [Chryseobacterium sp. StRB126]|uniref:DcaP family trimeric outer membrane transporter n=1 Tax=Chryseobacterium sp. StRB126 TaxID=878220 RepID=UPI0004E99ABB|nr:DcaP family trimeric outer membrane transporter [Chryseobacterium sp. StRB126]BAP32131.1 uncharacterized protein CHSO_3094 [Chryseobacterium sp. StRB126]
MKNAYARFVPLLFSALISCTKVSAQVTLITLKRENQREWDLYTKGLIQTDFMLDFQNMKVKDGFIAHSIEIPQHNSVNTNFSIKQSQIGLGIKQKTENGLSVYAEIDFYGPKGTTAPRLRHAYLQWNKWLIGQTWSNFSDLEIVPGIFDFVPPNGMIFTRRIQLRYTTPLSAKEILSISMEDLNIPSITLPADSLGWKKRAIIPTITTLYRYGSEKSYIKIGGILTPISYDTRSTLQDSYKTRTIMGWGALVSGKLYLNNNNIVSVQSSFGKGFETNNSNLNEEKYDAVPDPNNGNRLKTLPMFNLTGVYEHWWSPKWYSTAFISYSSLGNEDFISKDMTKNFQHIGMNIAFHPYKKMRIGIEGSYGRRHNFANLEAQAWRIQWSTSVSF